MSKKIQKGPEYEAKVKEESKRLNIQVVFMLIASVAISLIFFFQLKANPPAYINQAVEGKDLGGQQNVTAGNLL